MKLDRPRYDSQQARRILDRLVGYQISPLLWQKVKTGLSAGRVQSVALRLVCDRERAIMAFVPEEYWSLDACLDAGAPPPFVAHLVKHKNKNIKPGSVVAVEKILDALDTAEFRVAKIDTKPQRRNPAPPFITSSLQMEANRKLRFAPKKTMSLAQRLYEGKDLGDEGPVGLITYMRSDSTRVSAEALDAVRTFIGETYGDKYLPAAPNRFKSPKGAQEAHEAIRPTGVNRRPQDVKAFLSKDELALYELIWRRFVASQMTPGGLRPDHRGHRGRRLPLPGHRLGAEVRRIHQGLPGVPRIPKRPPAPRSFRLWPQGDVLQLRDFDPQQHFTKPPARFTEASLIKELEVQGIGRPSTYATILTNLQDRLYVVKEKTALKPTEMGLVVSDLLVENFPDIMDPKFTAGLEDNLDRVADGKVPWQQLMQDFYGPFAQDLDAAKTGMRRVKSVPTESEMPGVRGELVVRWGKNGEFVGLRRLSQVRLHRGFLPGMPRARSPWRGWNRRRRRPREKRRPRPTAARGKPGPTGLTCPKCGKGVAVAPGAAGRIFGLLRLPQVPVHPEFQPGPRGRDHPPVPGRRGRHPLPPGRLRRPPAEAALPPGHFLRLQQLPQMRLHHEPAAPGAALPPMPVPLAHEKRQENPVPQG